MTRSTRAVVLTSPQGSVEVRSVDIPMPGPREVLVRMEA
jgi:Zn-dependent alcohol dehydrogenase